MTTELNEAAMQDGDLRRMAIGIAGNKKDLEADREVSTKDATAYADSIGTVCPRSHSRDADTFTPGAFYMETSALANEGACARLLFMFVCPSAADPKAVRVSRVVCVVCARRS